MDSPQHVQPRWEWRMFGAPPDRARSVLATLTPDSTHDSDERYLLSVHSDASVKIRGGVMDVKHLQRVNDEGLELWMPVMKAAFPLSGDDVRFVLATSNVAVPPLGKAAYELDEFERDVVAPNGDLRTVGVHKRRTRYTIDDCMAELTELLTELRTDGSTTQTIAIESPDPALVMATIRKLGLDERRNVNMARGLKALAGLGARRDAVIDVGTNSVKFHVAERQADGALRTVVDRAEVTRLGEGLAESGRLAEAAIERTVDAIAGMVDEARRHGAVGIVAVGTAGLRQAPNRADLVDAVRARCDVTVEVISGEEEARLAYLAATSTLPTAQGRLVVFDSGGGSSQFTFGRRDRVDERFSVDVGAVRVTERHGLATAVSREVLEATLADVAAELDRLDDRERPDAIVAIGGTATNLAAVEHGLAEYDPDVVHGTVLDVAEIERQIELYRTRSADERRQIAGLQPARAEVILAGACIAHTILTKLHHESLTVSDRGLRHGVFVERFGSAR